MGYPLYNRVFKKRIPVFTGDISKLSWLSLAIIRMIIATIRKIRDDELFDGLGEKFLVMESHEEIIQNVPYNFVNLADSPNCAIEAIKHQVLPMYGVQFHPERFDDKHPAGIVILENFFNIATLYMK